MMHRTAPPSTPVSPTPQSSAARPFQFLQAQEHARLKLSERFWQERPTGGGDVGRLSMSSAASSGPSSCKSSPTVPSPADSPLCPPAQQELCLPIGVNGDTSPSVRPTALMGEPELAALTSSHSGTHVLQVGSKACYEPPAMAGCPEAAAEKLELEIAARERPHVPTDQELSQAREERTKQWRAAVRASGSLLVNGTAGWDRLAADWESHRSERALAVQQQMQMQQRVHLQQMQQHDAPSSAGEH